MLSDGLKEEKKKNSFRLASPNNKNSEVQDGKKRGGKKIIYKFMSAAS